MTQPKLVCFGELLLRLSAPAGELLLQTSQLKSHIGGAEANVAVSLARFGHATRMVSVVPDNPIGRAALEELRRHGVDVGGVQCAPGRMGIYFLTPGAGLRPSEVLYDRAGSAFAEAASDAVDWDRELAGADWLHLSGVTPAVGPQPAAAAVRAARAARDKGLTVSFDCNYRQKLWERWGGNGVPVLLEILECADLVFGDQRDVALLLGGAYDQDDPVDRRRAAAETAFARFPQLKRITSTIRTQHSVEEHELSGVLVARDGVWSTKTYPVGGIVDRIGGGDAFAAGLIHGLRTGMEPQAALEFGVAAGVLKHAISGDFNLASVDDVAALAGGGGLDVRR